MWTTDDDSGDRWSVAAPGWKFEEVDGLGKVWLGEGSLISGTVTDPDREFDIEHGGILIAGHSLAEMRQIVAMERAVK